MAKLPDSLIRTDVAGPSGGRRANAEDFGAGAETLISSQRAATYALRGSADAARAASTATRRGGEAQLAADRAQAAGLESLGDAATKVSDVLYQRKERVEKSDLNAKLADAQAKWASNLDETLRTADPGDTQVVPRFLKGFDDYSKQLSQGYETQGAKELAQDGVARLRGHFFETAMKGQAHLAELKAKQDYVTHQTKSSEANEIDPSGFALSIERHDAYVNDLVQNHGLSRAAAIQMSTEGRAELARAAFRGYQRIDPQNAIDRLKAGEFKDYIDGEQTFALTKSAEQDIEHRKTEARVEKSEAREAQRETWEKNFDDAFKAIQDGRAGWHGGEVDLAKVDVNGSQRAHLMALREAMSDKSSKLTDDPATRLRILDIMRDPTKTDAEKTQARNDALGHGISENTWHLAGQLASTQTQANKVFLDRIDEVARDKLLGPAHTRTAQSVDNYLQFTEWSNSEIQRLIKPKADGGAGLSYADIAKSDGPILSHMSTFQKAAISSGVAAQRRNADLARRVDAINNVAASAADRAKNDALRIDPSVRAFQSGLDNVDLTIGTVAAQQGLAKSSPALLTEPRNPPAPLAAVGAASGRPQIKPGEDPAAYMDRVKAWKKKQGVN